MLNRIISALRSLFGGNTKQAQVEDAAQIWEVNQRFIPEDSTNPNQMRTRSLSGADQAVFMDVSGNRGITINQPRYLWCLDNGHGSKQAGKRSPFFDDGTQLEEWEFNRDVVRRIAAQLDEAGVQYHVVVPEDQVGSFLRERVQRANQLPSPLGLPKIFVSVHANALGSNEWVDRARGLEVWHYPGSDSGQRLASVFHRALLAKLPTWVDRGIRAHSARSRSIFYVLANTAMPAVLTENGFYSHPEEASLLMQEETRQAIAEAHVAAILKVELEGWESQEVYPKSVTIAT